MASHQPRLPVARPLAAERYGLLRRGQPRSLDKRGAATGAPIHQRLGAVLIVGMQPVHHRVRASVCASGHFSGTAALRDVMQGQEPFAAAGMKGAQGQLAQIGWRLAATVRSQHVTPVLTEPPSGKAAIWVRLAPKQGPPLSNWTRFRSGCAWLAYAFDDEKPACRAVEPARQDLLVFR